MSLCKRDNIWKYEHILLVALATNNTCDKTVIPENLLSSVLLVILFKITIVAAIYIQRKFIW